MPTEPITTLYSVREHPERGYILHTYTVIQESLDGLRFITRHECEGCEGSSNFIRRIVKRSIGTHFFLTEREAWGKALEMVNFQIEKTIERIGVQHQQRIEIAERIDRALPASRD